MFVNLHQSRHLTLSSLHQLRHHRGKAHETLIICINHQAIYTVIQYAIGDGIKESMERPNEGQNAGNTGAVPLSSMEPNGALPTFNQDLVNQANPEAMAALMTGQPFVHDQNMGGLPMGDASFMLPMMMANGAANIPIQPNTISAGKFYKISASSRYSVSWPPMAHCSFR